MSEYLQCPELQKELFENAEKDFKRDQIEELVKEHVKGCTRCQKLEK